LGLGVPGATVIYGYVKSTSIIHILIEHSAREHSDSKLLTSYPLYMFCRHLSTLVLKSSIKALLTTQVTLNSQ